MKHRIHPDFNRVYGPDTVSIFKFFWPALLVVAIFLVSFLGLAYYHQFREWCDKVMDKSDQMKTGIVLLLIFLPVFSVCLFLAKKK